MERVAAMIGVLVGLLASGCFDPATPSDLPCGPGNSCPSSQACVQGVCRRDATQPDASLVDAYVPNGPATDIDNDGHPNATDNCPQLPNADQHDEDADAVGDVCDNCPHAANANQADTEAAGGDGVGDVCDPRPAVVGDTIALFLPFAAAPAADVVVPYGSWTIANDTYVQASTDGSELLSKEVRDWTTIEIAGTVTTQEDFVSMTTMFGFVAGANDEDKFHTCGYYDDTLANPDYFRVAEIERFNPDGDPPWTEHGGESRANRLTGEFKIRSTSDSVANLITCTTTDARGTFSSSFNNANALTPGTFGMQSEGATYALRYLIVFGRI